MMLTIPLSVVNYQKSQSSILTFYWATEIRTWIILILLL